jgi:hypothetical protein
MEKNPKYIMSPNEEKRYNECFGNKEGKRAVMCYPFKVSGGGEERKYVFFKLESSSAMSFAHILHAGKNYLLPGGENRKNSYPTRRESMNIVKENGKKTTFKKSIRTDEPGIWQDSKSERKHRGYYHLEKDKMALGNLCESSSSVDCEAVRSEFEFYNEYVRLRDEYFVPSSLAKTLLPQGEGTVSGGVEVKPDEEDDDERLVLETKIAVLESLSNTDKIEDAEYDFGGTRLELIAQLNAIDEIDPNQTNESIDGGARPFHRLGCAIVLALTTIGAMLV